MQRSLDCLLLYRLLKIDMTKYMFLIDWLKEIIVTIQSTLAEVTPQTQNLSEVHVAYSMNRNRM